MDTPWGWSQQHHNLTGEIVKVSTAEHGGIGVSRHRIAQLHPDLANYLTSHGTQYGRTFVWFEEDEEWAIPFFVFADDIKKSGKITPDKFEKSLTLARQWIEHAYPELPELVKRAYQAFDDALIGWIQHGAKPS